MANQFSLTIAVPVYNESEHVVACLEKLRSVASRWEWSSEIIIVDDGSTDGTDVVLQEWMQQADRQDVQVIRHDLNQGKGTAIRTALSRANGEWMIIQDADLEYDPSDIASLVLAAQQGEGDVVYGSRRLPEAGNSRRYNLFGFGVVVLNVAVGWLYRTRVTDEATCYKLLRTGDLRAMQLECKRFEFCPEVTAKACRMGLKIVERPIRYWPRDRDQGKKLTLADGWIALKTLWRYREWSPATVQVPQEVALPARGK